MATRTFSGGCHCGQVRYDVTCDLGEVISCNCSICAKRGFLWTFVEPDCFALRSGAESLSDYQFYKKNLHHLFCPECGVESFARGTKPDGTDMIAINVRCLDNVDLSKLTPKPVDGRKF
jgi:hypothetical protein